MVTDGQLAEAVQPDVVVAARALLTRLRRLHALQDAPVPWDSHTLHVDDRTALANAQAPGEARAALAAHLNTLEKQMAEYKAQFGAQLREAHAASLRNALSGSAEAASQDPVLNEEGLPFVDPLEMLPDSPPQTPQLDASAPRPMGNVLGRTPGQVAPFDPTKHGEERQQWMASIFDELQKEEDAELAKEQEGAEMPKVAGLRRGFLQGQKQQEPPKKQVRIVEPDVSSDEEEASPEPVSPEKVHKVPLGMDPEDAGVQEEAARIVDLLGPEVIRGHPNAERIFAEMEAAQPQMVQKAAPAPRAPAEPEKPAIGDVVVERSADADTRRTPSTGRKLSAFKQRQLERQRSQGAEDEAPVPPVGPSISQGLSAIERAGRVDDAQSASRIHAGLPPQVPHARPTKAYAAKLQQRAAATSKGQNMDEEEEIQAPGRRVRFGGEEVRHMDVDEDEDSDPDTSMDHVEGDIDDDDEFHQEPDDDDDSMPDDTWTSEDEMLWDSEDEYGPEDLEALKPSMDEHPQDAFWNEDLAREYAEAKARLALQPPAAAQAPSNEAEDNQEAYGVRTRRLTTDCAARRDRN